LNARANAAKNPLALFQKPVSLEEILASRMVHAPMQLFDCAPVCDGAACVIFARDDYAPTAPRPRVRLLASSVAVDRPAVADRPDPLRLEAARISAARAFAQAGLTPRDVDFFEVHDAFTIMACLALEACGFAAVGEGWKLAADGAIFPGGALPLSTFGGLLGRGHPIGATAVYQAAEILLQLQGRAGNLQVQNPRVALMQSVGGAGTTLFTHLFRAD
jgi:acetyl-CoA C-acetyltransferase